jgi:hypothetical protein
MPSGTRNYPFRAQRMQLMGYSEAQVRQMVLLSVPQLVTVVWSLSFTVLLGLDPGAHPPARSHKRCPDRFSRWVSHLGGNGRDHPVPGLADRSDLDTRTFHPDREPGRRGQSWEPGVRAVSCRPSTACSQAQSCPFVRSREGSISPLRRQSHALRGLKRTHKQGEQRPKES